LPSSPSASSVSFKETLFTFIFILFLAIIAVTYLGPPAIVPASAPVMEFSSEHAIENLKVIAREPHPTGSIANARVRDYIVEQLKLQRLEPQIQRTGIASLMDVFPGPYAAGTIENILARLKGSMGVVLLMAHYDSVAPAPGATDDGSGVVTLLETLRALRSGAPQRNDVVIVFTDGKELGMVGVQAFVDEHPWAKEISVALNLDSGGSGGHGKRGGCFSLVGATGASSGEQFLRVRLQRPNICLGFPGARHRSHIVAVCNLPPQGKRHGTNRGRFSAVHGTLGSFLFLRARHEHSAPVASPHRFAPTRPGICLRPT
jgi:hypothetical protein